MQHIPFSTRVYLFAALALTAVAAVLLLISTILCFATVLTFSCINPLNIISAVFALVGIFLAIKERLRGKYPLAIISLVLGIGVIVFLIVMQFLCA